MPTRFSVHSITTALSIIAVLATACTTTATTNVPTVSSVDSDLLTATAQNIAERQTAIAATSTAIQLTIEAGEFTATPSPTAEPATETPLPPSPTLAVATTQPATATSPTATLTTTSTVAATVATQPTATTVSGTAAAPIINSFTADRTQLNGGETLTFNWSTANGSQVSINHILSNSMFGGMGRGDLPATGSLSIVTDPNSVNTNKFILVVINSAGVTATQELNVTFNCKVEWFFLPEPDFCASDVSQNKTLIEQMFENGRMIWIPYSQGYNYISILYNDGTVYTTADMWTNAEPDSDPNLVPPAGLLQPVRGFGKVWREVQSIKDKLGWATGPETQYTSQYQHEGGSIDLKGWNTFLQVADGRVIHIIGHYVDHSWEFVGE
jgi:hypothetical protein